MSPERFVKGESERTCKISVDWAALTHRLSVNLCLKTGVLRPFAPKLPKRKRCVPVLRAKGMVVKWDVQAIPTMNRKDYYFFWIYNATAQAQRDLGSVASEIARSKSIRPTCGSGTSRTRFFMGTTGELVEANGLERLQEEPRKKYGIDPSLIQEYRSAHLANKIIPRG